MPHPHFSNFGICDPYPFNKLQNQYYSFVLLILFSSFLITKYCITFLPFKLRHVPRPYGKKLMFWIYVFGARHMLHPSLEIWIFSLNLLLEVKHVPQLYKTKFYVLNLCFRDEAHASPSLRNLKFPLSLEDIIMSL